MYTEDEVRMNWGERRLYNRNVRWQQFGRVDANSPCEDEW